jgi:hypothetical protein
MSLEVHTVVPSREDAGYARTREFYLASGFLSMNESSASTGTDRPWSS